MEKNVQVSVICNTYNHEKYIRDALEGFVKQKTNFAFEVLVHDDASTDNTADIIREYEAKYPNIIKPVYQTENQRSKKIPINKTFQIPRIKGKYIAFCEGDDYWTDSFKLQKQYDFMETHPDYSMCTCSTIWLDMKVGKERNKCRTEIDREIPIEEIILEKKGRIFQLATFLIRADMYLHLPDWFSAFGVGDLPIALYAAISGKVYMLSDVMAVYRYNAEGSWTSRVQNLDFRTNALTKIINGYNAFNQGTDYKYDDLVTKRIKMTKYNLARKKRDFKALKSDELIEIYKSKDFLHRMVDYLMCKFPKLYSLLIKIIGADS